MLYEVITEVSVHVTSTAVPQLCGTLTNTASVTADNFTQEVIATADIFIDCCPNIRVIKRANDSSVFPGEQASFTISVINAGDGPVENAVMTDVLPPSFSWTIVDGVGSEYCAITNGTLSCEFPTMMPGDRYNITVV